MHSCGPDSSCWPGGHFSLQNEPALTVHAPVHVATVAGAGLTLPGGGARSLSGKPLLTNVSAFSVR